MEQNLKQNLQKNRFAVATFFFANGFLHANFMARLPLLQTQLGVSNSILGTLLFTVAIGALVGMPIAGGLAERLGSDKLTRITALLFCLFLPLIPMTQNVWLSGVLFFLMGANMGSMDVCMNGQAVYVERLWQKPIMSSFHAVFSIGLTLGAGVGALFSKFDTALSVHIWSIAVLCILLIWGASPFLLKESATKNNTTSEKKGFNFPHKAIVPLGLIAFCCMTGEGSMTDWSAIYMIKIVGKDAAWGAMAFGVYATGMTLGRVFGDFNTQKLGKRRLMLINAFLAIGGLSLALMLTSVATTLLGFFMVGVGVSTIVPIVFSTAGNTEGVNPSVGIAMATSIGYTGFFVGPPVIGFLSDAYGLPIGLGFSLGLFALMLVLILKFIKK